jgi:hypothetical protein
VSIGLKRRWDRFRRLSDFHRSEAVKFNLLGRGAALRLRTNLTYELMLGKYPDESRQRELLRERRELLGLQRERQSKEEFHRRMQSVYKEIW